jgi:hypothetical protein
MVSAVQHRLLLPDGESGKALNLVSRPEKQRDDAKHPLGKLVTATPSLE